MSKNLLIKMIILSFVGIILVITAYNLWAFQGTLLRTFIADSNTDDPHQPVAAVLKDKNIMGSDFWLEVNKSNHTLTLYSGKTILKKYRIALSKDTQNDKQKADDGKTPVGEFIIAEKQILSPPKRFLGSRLFWLNYPTGEDSLRGLHDGLITGKDFLAIKKALDNNTMPPQDTKLGGNIAIHGGGGPFMGDNWTKGSIGLYSKDAEELYDLLPAGTRVVIRK